MSTSDRGKRVANSYAALTHPEELMGVRQGSAVTERERAALVVSVALWSLREVGVADLRIRQYRRLWWQASELAVELLGSPTVEHGLERVFLNEVRVELALRNMVKGEIAVRHVIHAWLGGVYSNPYREVIRRVEDLAIDAGWHEAALVPRSNRIARLFGPRKVVVPASAHAAALQTAASALASEWLRFRRHETSLADRLMGTVTDAIRDRTYEPID